MEAGSHQQHLLGLKGENELVSRVAIRLCIWYPVPRSLCVGMYSVHAQSRTVHVPCSDEADQAHAGGGSTGARGAVGHAG